MNLFEKTAHELHDMLVNKEISAVEITKEFKLYFPAESGRKFYLLVKDYVIPEMQYKFKDICVSKILWIWESPEEGNPYPTPIVI